MQKNVKKIFLSILPIFMLLTSVNLPAFAEPEDQSQANKGAEDTQVDLSVLDDADFSSGRLLVSEEALQDDAQVIGTLDGLALVQYETEEAAKEAYLELSEKTEVMVDTDSFGIAEDTDVNTEATIETETKTKTGAEAEAETDVEVETETEAETKVEAPAETKVEAKVETPVETEVPAETKAETKVETPVETVLTENSNPFTEVEKTEVDKVQYDIAVIDTGATEADSIVSVLGDDGIDYHGHGQNMINTIKGINPNAKVLSIKALDNSGVGGTSAIYAAIRIAIDNQVKIINLSISATKTEDNKIIEEIINEAVEKGIKVVGAAGNNNIDAANTIPGGIENAVVIGASDNEGNKLPNSNFGATVDAYLPAQSTSYASAKASAYLSLDKTLEEALKTETTGDATQTDTQEPTDEFSPANGGAGGAAVTPPGGGDGGTYYAGSIYRWYDKKSYYNDNDNQFTLAELNSTGSAANAKLEAQVKSWADWLIADIKSNNTHIPSSLNVYAARSQEPNQPYVASKEPMRAALKAAINRLPASERSTARARVVAMGFTYAVRAGEGWTVINPPLWNWTGSNATAPVAKTYYGWDVIESGADYNDIPKNLTYVGKDGVTINWDDIIDITKFNDASPNQTWRQYAYAVAKKDWADQGLALNEYNDGSVWVIAVTDNYPSNGQTPININLTKASANTRITNNNDCYSLAGAEYTIYTDSTAKTPLKDINGNTVTLKTNASGKASKTDIYVTTKPTTIYAKETKAPKGYALSNTIYSANLDSNDTATFTADKVKDNPVEDPIILAFEKMSEDGINAGSSTAGTEITVEYFDNTAGTTSGTPFASWTYSSKELHDSMSSIILADATFLKAGETPLSQVNGRIMFPLGTYRMTETKAAPGYLPQGKTDILGKEVNFEDGIVFKVIQNGNSAKAVTLNDESLTALWTEKTPIVENKIIRGGVDVYKIVDELQKVQNEGQSSLAGNTFNIVNASGYDVVVNDKAYGSITDANATVTSLEESSVAKVTNITRTEIIDAKNAVGNNGAVVKTLTVDENGYATTTNSELPAGVYYIYEAETNSSMLLDDDFVLRAEIREDGKIVSTKDLPAENPIVRGDLYFTKVNEDGVRRPNTPFLIAALDDEGKIIESHVIVTDSSGIASTAFTYTTVEEDNILETTQAERKHSSNTNGFDKYVKKNADGSYSVTEDGEALLASGEASTYGVWFSQGLDVETGKIVKNSKADVDDARGALYYGTFQIFEVQCKENKDLGEDLLISKPFRIKNKNQVYNASGDLMSESDKNVKENELRYADAFVDLEVLLDTRAKNVITDTQTTFADREVVLSDTIAFSNIKSTSTYKWEIDFVETETGNVLSTVVVDKFKPENTNNGVSTTNQPKMTFTVKTDGTISPATNIDGSVNKGYQGTPEVTTTGNVDTTGLGGKSISVVVELYEYITGYDFDSEDDYKEFEAINFITSHNIDRTDENEKIYIPNIETVAQDKYTKDHVGTKDKEDSIKDTVSITGISPKEKYQLVAYVWDLDEDKLFSDKKVVKDFYSDRANVSHIEDLTVEMQEFELDSSNFADKTLVVFEELWRVDDKGNPIDDYPLAVHKDKLDEDQSIHYIDIDTELTDEFTGDHVGTVTEKVTLTDKVDLKNLLKGMEYVIKGNLVYRADGTTKDGKAVKAGDQVPVLDGSKTEVKFTPEESGDHTVYITYIVDSRNLEGIDVVSTEEAYHNDVLIDRHYDLEDDDQTVNFPKVGTVAVDSKTDDNVGTVLEDGTIIDTVEVCNLVAGEDYTITGKLVLQEDGSELKDVVSEPYSFTATKEQEGCSFVEITFKNVDATKIVGKSVVAFEYLTHTSKKTNEPVEVAKHEDIEDDAQTIHFPDVRTEATDRRTGDKVGSIFGKVTNIFRRFFGQDVLEEDETEIIDKVILTNLALDKTYTVKGKLMDQETGELLNGQEITAEDEIYVGKDGTLKAKNGSKVAVTNYDEKNHQVDGYIELVFKLGTDEITNKSVVVFEKLFHKNSKTGEDIEVNKHEDIDDRAQFVNLIEVDSVAVDKNTQDHVGDLPGTTLEDTKIIETFNMRKLVNGQDYKVDFALVVREESAKQGKPIYLTEEGSFTDDRTKAMTKVVEFKALAEKEVSGWRVIVNGEELFVGETHDEAQAFYNEYLSKLTDEEKANAEVYLIEKFTEMQPDEEAFSAGATLEVEFDIKHDTARGYTLVVVADTYHNDTIIAIHNDINNELESVHYPKIETEAYDGQTLNHIGVAAEETVLVDKVFYENLIIGQEYEINGYLMLKGTNDIYLDADGNKVEGTTGKFIAEEPAGYKEIEFKFNGANLKGETLVAFEDLYHNDIHIDMHHDIEDEDQSVHYPKIETEAKLGKVTVNNKTRKAKVSDTVTYTNLIPGQQYTLEARMMNKGTNKPITTADGKELIVTKTFTPLAADGKVVVELELEDLPMARLELVAFEKLFINYENDGERIEIASHEDINDKAQTVIIPEPVKPPTADTNKIMLYTAYATISILVAAIAILLKKKQILNK